MPNVIITDSRRGIFDKEEWKTFYDPETDFREKRVFLRCRNPACWSIWTMSPEVFKVRVEDLENNPIECDECLNADTPRDRRWDITMTWCNHFERPYTWIGKMPSDADQAKYNSELAIWQAFVTANGFNPRANPVPAKPGEARAYQAMVYCQGTGSSSLQYTSIRDMIKANMDIVREFRDTHMGRDPRPEDTAAWTAHEFVKNHMWAHLGGDNEAHHWEVFHQHLPSAYYYRKAGDPARITDLQAAFDPKTQIDKYKLEDQRDMRGHRRFPKSNDHFYRAILNMKIQTEVLPTGGSA